VYRVFDGEPPDHKGCLLNVVRGEWELSSATEVPKGRPKIARLFHWREIATTANGVPEGNLNSSNAC
jgi:hypothetical protein